MDILTTHNKTVKYIPAAKKRGFHRIGYALLRQPFTVALEVNIMKYFLIFTFFVSQYAHSCTITCPSLQERFNWSNYAFIGKVVSAKKDSPNSFSSNIVVEFAVSKEWVGSWGSRKLYTHTETSSCEGGNFEKNRTYVLLIQDLNKISVCHSLTYSRDLEKKIDKAARNLEIIKEISSKKNL